MNNVLKAYDLDAYIFPYWEGKRINHESVMFLEDEFTARLLFPADEILSVTSSDLSVEYIRGKDYDLVEGCLVRLENSSIPFYPLADYYPQTHNTEVMSDFGCTVEGHEFIRYGEGDTFISKQVLVTYRHSSKWTGFIPQKQNKFVKFLNKLKNGESVKVLFYGDSITTGANSSEFINRPPYAEIWPKMVVSGMKQLTGNQNIEYINTAVGGMASGWGLENIEERVIKYEPDLLILAFGMNDNILPEAYIDLNSKMVDAVHAALPNCEICLVATMLPHYRVAGFFNHQYQFEAALTEYAAQLPFTGVAPVTSVHDYMLKRKEYYHMTGNNVNHPNDFLARAYTMTILKVICGYRF